MRASGRMVTGSTIIPDSDRFTLSTSSAWTSIGRFLCTTPRPPCWASAMARRASVTVSMAAATIGTLRRMPRHSQVPQVHLVGVDLGEAGNQGDVVEGEGDAGQRLPSRRL